MPFSATVGGLPLLLELIAQVTQVIGKLLDCAFHALNLREHALRVGAHLLSVELRLGMSLELSLGVLGD